MNNKNFLWATLLLASLIYLGWRGTSFQAGAVYVRQHVSEVQGDAPGIVSWKQVSFKEKNEPEVVLSWPRTLGVWLSAAFTIAIFSFLFGDNPLYKVAESIFIGASAAYAMIAAFWPAFMGLLIGRLFPKWSQETFNPGSERTEPEWLMLIPLTMGIMFLWRLAPRGQWISRWPLAFFIAVFAGIRLVSFFQTDFIEQINNTILPLIVFAADGSLDIKTSLWNMTMVFGTLACLTYFFFSLEHTGLVGGVSKVGIYLLMITFGVGFALTVMSRYSLLIGRMNFLLKDWLHIGIEM
jgi:hypothetical protein